MTATNTKLSFFLYPYVFIIMVAGFWFGSIGDILEINLNHFTKIPGTYLVLVFH
jgi:hypothetical protein